MISNLSPTSLYSFPSPYFPTLYSPPLHCSQNEAFHHVLILSTLSASHMVGCCSRTLLQTCKCLPSIKQSLPLFLMADSFFGPEAGQKPAGYNQQSVEGRKQQKLLWVPRYRIGKGKLLRAYTSMWGPKVAGYNPKTVGYFWGGHPLPYGAQELQGESQKQQGNPWLAVH